MTPPSKKTTLRAAIVNLRTARSAWPETLAGAMGRLASLRPIPGGDASEERTGW
ncbi:hypothetical protein [Rhizobium sp. BK377]|uniref:hypothetical protein n=1 Tax=Rhizobium sp. BK377 TaxID=2587058 RepID=UPI001618B51A|nr:hypothetical protein [Rhizobium sp. BK377]MBB3464291.1 hypothetical protein [Rhizobium sp. BK377]